MTDRNRNLHTMIWVMAVVVTFASALRIGAAFKQMELAPVTVTPELQMLVVCADTLTPWQIGALEYGLRKLGAYNPRRKRVR